MNTDETKKLNQAYANSLTKEDDFDAVLTALTAKKGLAEHIIDRFLLEANSTYINLCGDTKSDALRLLAPLVPELFASTFRQAVISVLFYNDLPMEVDRIREWLEQSHPEQLRDALAEKEEIDARSSSPAMIKHTDDFLKKITGIGN